MKAKSRPERILLISDLHLEEERPALTQAFLNFLQQEGSQASTLYILGDFFNVWIGDDDDRPLNALVSAALRQQAEAGLAIFLMHGNRDFILGERFAEAAASTLIGDPYLLEYGNRRYLLSHGDQYCTQDLEYQAFRTQVRNPAWQQAALGKPLAERRAFAAQVRAASKSMSSNRAEDIADVTQSAVEAALAQFDCSTLIHGHTHRPATHRFVSDGRQRERIVLGDWGAKGWFVELTPQGASLHHFDISA